jgi:hypothetical protein
MFSLLKTVIRGPTQIERRDFAAPAALTYDAPEAMDDHLPGLWPRERFFLADEAWSVCPPSVDVTGPSRFLIHGPGVSIEPGRWRAQIRFELCPDAARWPYIIEFGAGTNYTACLFRGGHPGAHEVVLEHRMAPGDLAFIRIVLARAAFHGEFRFLNAHTEMCAA